MADDMPLLDIVFYAQQVYLFCQAVEIAGTVGRERSFTHAGKIDSKAMVAAGKLLHNAAPQQAIGRHTVNEQDSIASTLVNAMHDAAFLLRERFDWDGGVWSEAGG